MAEDLKKIYTVAVDSVIEKDLRTRDMDTVRVFFSQGDIKSAFLSLDLTENGIQIDLTSKTVRVAFRKPDGTSVILDTASGVTVVNAAQGKIQVLLTPQVLAIKGKVRGQVVVSDATGLVTESTEFAFSVRESLSNNAVESSDELPLIEQAIEAAEILGPIDLQTIVNNTTNVNNLKTEVEQARGGKVNLKTRLDEMKTGMDANTSALSESARQTQSLVYGNQIINATETAPADIEIEGRTLVNMSNSNLLSDKKYVLADKKTKVIVDNKTVAGVGKFQKNNTLTRKPTFAGKVAGSTVDNPHIMKATTSQTALQTPTGTWTEFGQSGTGYNEILTLNGSNKVSTTTVINGISQHLISFDLISEVERNMGVIPGANKAEKVLWLKDNISRTSLNWHGFGSNPTGNKATLYVSNANNLSWVAMGNHTASIVTKIAGVLTNGASPGWFGPTGALLDADGFNHYLVASEASNGTIASTLNTDFVELEIELKTTAQLDTRPAIIKLVNYEGKTAGDLTVNPHIAKSNATKTDTAILPPSSTSWGEFGGSYASISALGGATAFVTTVANLSIVQNLFSIDIITEFERTIGKIPKVTTADKVAWLRANFKELRFAWWGFGSGPLGNKATLRMWGNGTYYGTAMNHTQGTIQKLTISSQLTSAIADDGFASFVAISEPSDGVTPSAITTDYVEFELEMKAGADFTDPMIPLYEVDDSEYTKILAEWDETKVMERYPSAVGVQHVQNPYVMAEGENLLPPFYDWILGNPTSTALAVKSPYELEMLVNSGGSTYTIDYYLNVIPGQTYTFKADSIGNALGGVLIRNDAGSITIVSGTQIANGKITFTIPAGVTRIYVRLYNMSTVLNNAAAISKPMLVLGSVEKPFVPRNPAYLMTQVKLGQVGSVKDRLFKQDGAWKVHKRIEKDFVLDGSLPWGMNVDGVGTKRLSTPLPNSLLNSASSMFHGTDFRGAKVPSNNAYLGENGTFISGTGSFVIWIPDNITGFGETYSPVNAEMQAFFNGWQAKTVDGAGKPTAWKSLVTGADAPTQTLAYVSVNKAPNFTPYKISYQLATPATIDISDAAEGEISVNKSTQLEVGSGVIVREKVTPILEDAGIYYYINATFKSASLLKNKAAKIIKVYKNGVPQEWRILNSTSANGLQHASILKADFDATAEYTVTYQVLDKNLFTAPPMDGKATFAGSLRTAFNDTVQSVEDLRTIAGINTRSIAELYKRIKSLGG